MTTQMKQLIYKTRPGNDSRNRCSFNRLLKVNRDRANLDSIISVLCLQGLNNRSVCWLAVRRFAACGRGNSRFLLRRCVCCQDGLHWSAAAKSRLPSNACSSWTRPTPRCHTGVSISLSAAVLS